ncbi:MAG: SO_0444 family Cu/Zn efflux transporter [Cellvibrionales bacterium]|nr:SO_0444 family Cu/Zn efflux transporter [Cellvibrionales bacterium]
MEFFQHFINLFNESAPWLLLGLIIAGFIKAFISENYLTKHLGGKGIMTTIKAAFIGAPLPLCSCGVVPAALGIRRAGGSKNATVSFLVATPETGLDSMTVTYALMGPFMAIIRPIAAIASAIVSGILVGSANDEPSNANTTTESESCCSSKPKTCCESETSIKPSPKKTFGQKLQQGIHFSFFDMLDDIVVWLFIGLGFAALVQTFVPTSFLSQWGDSWVAFIIMALIGVPMYICATASTPIAAGLLLSGVSPGAVLVFMLAGPATNIGTVGIVLKELGKKSLIAYLTGVIVTSFIFGALTNYLVNHYNISIISEVTNHSMSMTFFTFLCSIFMAALCVISIGKKLMVKQ